MKEVQGRVRQDHFWVLLRQLWREQALGVGEDEWNEEGAMIWGRLRKGFSEDE